ncbi:hypothetical protein XENORESO_014970 [Xenotaenia resolanae]|uniref:Secreted protein n=1 Tax=Xenotaenia resolanae TaxID=208358 RepID=A0ABV0WZ70_9TELE
MNCCFWQQFQSHHNLLLVLLLLRLLLAEGIYVAADLSYRAAHLSGAASAGSNSTLLQIANVALNNKWTTRSSFSHLFKAVIVSSCNILFVYTYKPQTTHWFSFGCHYWRFFDSHNTFYYFYYM